MKNKTFSSGLRELDTILGGGIPEYGLNILSGPPGSGKSVLAQQMMFSSAKRGCRCLNVATLSEPAMKVMRYMSRFSFFDEKVFGDSVIYHDMGDKVREGRLDSLAQYILDLVQEYQPDLMVIDSFKAIRDMVQDEQAFRLFVYDLAVNLASSRCTTLLIGEYYSNDIYEKSEFALADGIITLDAMDMDGERQRLLQVVKTRGQEASLLPQPFCITHEGIAMVGAQLLLDLQQQSAAVGSNRMDSGIAGLNELLEGGIPSGRSVLLSGASGTGKTTLALQFLVQGAMKGERGMIFSLEETPVRLRQAAKNFGWDLEGFERKGLIKVLFTPQDRIRLESDLSILVKEVEEFAPSRLVIDSLSLYMHRVTSMAQQRSKTFQIASLIRNKGMLGLLISDISEGSGHGVSRFGVEETIVDGVIVLSNSLEGRQRRRYLEVYKMRGVAHQSGRHRMDIGSGGIVVLDAKPVPGDPSQENLQLEFGPLAGLTDAVPPHRYSWLVRGNSGLGKSSMARQFTKEGLAAQESVILCCADITAEQELKQLQALGCDTASALEDGRLLLLDVGGDLNGLLGDPALLLHELKTLLMRVPAPSRVVIDSLSLMTSAMDESSFSELVLSMVRMLVVPGTALLATVLDGCLSTGAMARVENIFDCVVELHKPDWAGQDISRDDGGFALTVKKARGVGFDSRSYPFTVVTGEGVRTEREFYLRQESNT